MENILYINIENRSIKFLNEVSIMSDKINNLERGIMVGSYKNAKHGPRIKIFGKRGFSRGNSNFISLFKNNGNFEYKYGNGSYDKLSGKEKTIIEDFFNRYEQIIQNNYDFNYNRNPKANINDQKLYDIIVDDEKRNKSEGSNIIRDYYGNIIRKE